MWKILKNPIRTLSGGSNVTPAITVGTELLETFAFQHVGEINQSSSSSRRASGTSEEVLEVLFVLVVLGWKILYPKRFPLPKEIGHEDLGAQGLRQNVSSLQSLREVARSAGWQLVDIPQTEDLPENIVNDDQGNLALIACDVDTIESAVGRVGALGGVVRLDCRNRAAGLVGVMHSRHGFGKRIEMARDNPKSSEHP